MTSVLDDAYPRKQYRHPPVVEAIARIHLADSMPWSLTLPGLLFSRVSTAYPDEPKFQNFMQAQLGAQAGDGGESNFQLTAGPQKVIFGADNGTRLLIIGGGDISVHGLQPYEGWESLESRLFEAIELVGDLMPSNRIDGMGVRYINRVEIPSTEISFEDYLTIAFVTPPGFPRQINAFMDRLESAYPDGKSRISFTWATTEAPEGSAAFIIDLDLNWTTDTPVDLAEARVELNSLKRKETMAFESLLQDRLREAFDEVG